MGIEQATLSGTVAARASAGERVRFIRRTYAHLAGAIAAFTAIEFAFFQTGVADDIARALLGTRWWLVLIAFMVVGWVADRWARSGGSQAKQYVGLTLYVAAEAVIVAPLLYLAARLSDPTVIPTAALLTLLVFAGLTGTVFLTKKDFSFLRGFLAIASMLALGVVFASMIFGFSLGLVFSVAMVGLAAGYILYDTSAVLREYRTDQHVAAALALFAAVALMFYYILTLVMRLAGRD